MLLERMHKFGHVVTAIVKDKAASTALNIGQSINSANLLNIAKLQAFSRGEANLVFNSCSGNAHIFS